MASTRAIIITVCLVVILISTSLLIASGLGLWASNPFAKEPTTVETIPFSSITNYTALFSPIKVTSAAHLDLLIPAGFYRFYVDYKEASSILITNKSEIFLTHISGGSEGGLLTLILPITQIYSWNVSGTFIFFLTDYNISEQFLNRVGKEIISMKSDLRFERIIYMNQTCTAFDFEWDQGIALEYHAISEISVQVLDQSWYPLEKVNNKISSSLVLHGNGPYHITIWSDRPQNITIAITTIKNVKVRLPSIIPGELIWVVLFGVIIVAACIANIAFFMPHIKKKK